MYIYFEYGNKIKFITKKKNKMLNKYKSYKDYN